MDSPSTLCRTIEPEALKQGNMSSLGFTSKEQRNLGLLVHLMTSNPKILYAPVGTEVDKVIMKVRMHRLGPLSSHQSCSADGLCGREEVGCQDTGSSHRQWEVGRYLHGC